MEKEMTPRLIVIPCPRRKIVQQRVIFVVWTLRAVIVAMPERVPFQALRTITDMR
jgi:hypothetical protein